MDLCRTGGGCEEKGLREILHKALKNRLRIILREKGLINTLGEISLNITLSATTIIKGCVYSEGDHRSAECQNISSTNEGKKILSERRLCFTRIVKNLGP